MKVPDHLAAAPVADALVRLGLPIRLVPAYDFRRHVPEVRGAIETEARPPAAMGRRVPPAPASRVAGPWNITCYK